MWTIKRSHYRACLKYYAEVHCFQSKSYQQMKALLELLRSHSASGPAVLGIKTRATLAEHLARLESVNQFCKVGIEQTLQSTPFLSFKPIIVWDCYRVLHDQENMNDFLRIHYFKVRLLINELGSHYRDGVDTRIVGAYFIRHLKGLMRDLDRIQQRHGEWLRYLHHCLLDSVGDLNRSPLTKWQSFKKQDVQSHDAPQFFRLMTHCNRPFTRSECRQGDQPCVH